MYTKVIDAPDSIIKEIIRINESSNELSICATAGGMQFTCNYLFEPTKKLIDSVEGRWIETVGREKVYFKDKNRLIWVICDDSTENRNFFSEYKKKLEIRYHQRSIFMLITSNVSIVS